MSKYLVTTELGNVYSLENDVPQLLLQDNTISIYTGDSSIRFIKKYKDGYILGKSDSLLLWHSQGGRLVLPGLIDIQDVALSNNYIFILSGLRDSIYVLNHSYEFVTAFNINSEGKLEFFKNRQVQCNEIPSNYFQIFYCPGMNNYHDFNRLLYINNQLFLLSDVHEKSIYVSLSDMSIHSADYAPPLMYDNNITNKFLNEKVTDYIYVG